MKDSDGVIVHGVDFKAEPLWEFSRFTCMREQAQLPQRNSASATQLLMSF